MTMRVMCPADEIEKVAKRLKKGESTGTDEINSKKINQIYPSKELQKEKPLQKQGKIHWKQ